LPPLVGQSEKPFDWVFFMLNEHDPWTDQDENEVLDRFPNRRQRSRSSQDGLERRQFSSNYSELSPAGAELGQAIDSYKVANHRRYVTYDEILQVLSTLGYHRTTENPPISLPTSATSVAPSSPSLS